MFLNRVFDKPPLKTSPKSLPRQGPVLCILEAMHIYNIQKHLSKIYILQVYKQ
jgi:hypothetical protein